MPEPQPLETIEVRKLNRFFQSLLAETPERMWLRIRAYLPRTNEEYELLNIYPELKRAMEIGAIKAVARMRSGQIKAEELDEAFRIIHDKMNELRNAIGQVFKLAGMIRRKPDPPARSKNEPIVLIDREKEADTKGKPPDTTPLAESA